MHPRAVCRARRAAPVVLRLEALEERAVPSGFGLLGGSATTLAPTSILAAPVGQTLAGVGSLAGGLSVNVDVNLAVPVVGSVALGADLTQTSAAPQSVGLGVSAAATLLPALGGGVSAGVQANAGLGNQGVTVQTAARVQVAATPVLTVRTDAGIGPAGVGLGVQADAGLGGLIGIGTQVDAGLGGKGLTLQTTVQAKVGSTPVLTISADAGLGSAGVGLGVQVTTGLGSSGGTSTGIPGTVGSTGGTSGGAGGTSGGTGLETPPPTLPSGGDTGTPPDAGMGQPVTPSPVNDPPARPTPAAVPAVTPTPVVSSTQSAASPPLAVVAVRTAAAALPAVTGPAAAPVAPPSSSGMAGNGEPAVAPTAPHPLLLVSGQAPPADATAEAVPPAAGLAAALLSDPVVIAPRPGPLTAGVEEDVDPPPSESPDLIVACPSDLLPALDLLMQNVGEQVDNGFASTWLEWAPWVTLLGVAAAAYAVGRRRRQSAAALAATASTETMSL